MTKYKRTVAKYNYTNWCLGALATLVAVFLISKVLFAEPIEAYKEVTGDHVKGSAIASLTLIEYSDFQCPACGRMAPIIEQLSEAFPNDLKVIYRHYPLTSIHPNAYLGAKASEAAAIQGKFWEMHDLLFANQKIWANMQTPENALTTYAETIGLDIEKFKQDLESKETEKRVDENIKAGNVARINSTPSLFLNGEKINNGNFEDLKILIEEKLKTL